MIVLGLLKLKLKFPFFPGLDLVFLISFSFGVKFSVPCSYLCSFGSRVGFIYLFLSFGVGKWPNNAAKWLMVDIYLVTYNINYASAFP